MAGESIAEVQDMHTRFVLEYCPWHRGSSHPPDGDPVDIFSICSQGKGRTQQGREEAAPAAQHSAVQLLASTDYIDSEAGTWTTVPVRVPR
jgi:hypothetical protein